MSERKTIIQTVGLKKYYTVGGNTVRALDGVDMSVQQGEFVALRAAAVPVSPPC